MGFEGVSILTVDNAKLYPNRNNQGDIKMKLTPSNIHRLQHFQAKHRNASTNQYYVMRKNPIKVSNPSPPSERINSDWQIALDNHLANVEYQTILTMDMMKSDFERRNLPYHSKLITVLKYFTYQQ